MTHFRTIQDGRSVCLGFVHHYKSRDEHCHDTYEELLVCHGTATQKQQARALKAAASRTGKRGKHARRAPGAADKPTSPESVSA